MEVGIDYRKIDFRSLLSQWRTRDVTRLPETTRVLPETPRSASTHKVESLKKQFEYEGTGNDLLARATPASVVKAQSFAKVRGQQSPAAGRTPLASLDNKPRSGSARKRKSDCLESPAAAVTPVASRTFAKKAEGAAGVSERGAAAPSPAARAQLTATTAAFDADLRSDSDVVHALDFGAAYADCPASPAIGLGSPLPAATPMAQVRPPPPTPAQTPLTHRPTSSFADALSSAVLSYAAAHPAPVEPPCSPAATIDATKAARCADAASKAGAKSDSESAARTKKQRKQEPQVVLVLPDMDAFLRQKQSAELSAIQTQGALSSAQDVAAKGVATPKTPNTRGVQKRAPGSVPRSFDRSAGEREATWSRKIDAVIDGWKAELSMVQRPEQAKDILVRVIGKVEAVDTNQRFKWQFLQICASLVSAYPAWVNADRGYLMEKSTAAKVAKIVMRMHRQCAGEADELSVAGADMCEYVLRLLVECHYTFPSDVMAYFQDVIIKSARRV